MSHPRRKKGLRSRIASPHGGIKSGLAVQIMAYLRVGEPSSVARDSAGVVPSITRSRQASERQDRAGLMHFGACDCPMKPRGDSKNNRVGFLGPFGRAQGLAAGQLGAASCQFLREVPPAALYLSST